MSKINDQWWIDLDPYVDVESLLKDYDKFCWAIGKNYKYIMCATHGANCLYDKKYLDLGNLLYLDPAKQSEEFRELTKDMNQRNLRLFYIHYFKTRPMNYNLILRGNRDKDVDYTKKHLPENAVSYPAARHFNFFWEWLENQNVFTSIGRTVLFLSESKDPIGSAASNHVHRDYADGKSYKDQFIWIRFDPAKKFFVYDTENKTKNYVTSNVCVFDNSAWHGVEDPNQPCFSLRVDGTFTDEFLEKTNLKQHFKP